MHSLALTLLACFIFSIAQAFVPCVPGLRAKNAQRVGAINVVPLELEGQLDPTKTWDVKMTYKGETKVLTVSEDTCILEAAEKEIRCYNSRTFSFLNTQCKEWDVPCSCRNGICTTCAGRVIANPDSKKEAIHGLSAEQSKNGFVLTCQTHPCGPGLEVELGMYDTVYESQYGQYEKKATTEQKSKFNVFG